MTSLHRFLSASAASWVKILLTVLSQLLLVPVFLGHWTVEQYGCWLIIQTIVGVCSLFSAGHQAYVGFEFLKLGDRKSEEIRRLFYSALPSVLLISALELLAISSLVYFGYIRHIIDPDNALSIELRDQTSYSLILYSLSWLISSSAGGLAGRAVAPYGYFPRMTWWATLIAAVIALTSAVAVSLGANLLQTVLWIVVATFLVNVPVHLDMWRIFRRIKLYPVAPDWQLGRTTIARSLAISLSNVLEISRQQGVRVFLGALIGVKEMTAFSTMRTMSNFSLQGIGTVTVPIMPEIMRFLRDRDEERTKAAIGFVWFFAVILLSPTLIAFQWVMPKVFHAWTRGKIGYDPTLFGMFSTALLVFSVARPPIAVLQGNNLLRTQLWISTVVSLIAIGGILLFASAFGVRGAAMSLLLAELVGTTLAVWLASLWLKQRGIGFPWRLFVISSASIVFAVASVFAMAWEPAMKLWVLLLSGIVNIGICMLYVRHLPPLAIARLRKMSVVGF